MEAAAAHLDPHQAYAQALAIERQYAPEQEQLCEESFAYWLEHYCYTFNEHAPASAQVAQFPAVAAYVRLARLLPRMQRFLCVKSRQIMMSWFCMAYILWRLLYGGSAVRALVQSETEDKAKEQIDRLSHMYKMLPPWAKELHPIESKTSEKMHFRALDGGPGAKVYSIPQGGDKPRSYTATVFFQDECAFQAEFPKAYSAGRAMVMEGGQWLGVSTPNGKNFFHTLYADDKGTLPPAARGQRLPSFLSLDKGLEHRANRNRICVVRAHYSMLPWRDPDTAKGKAWYEEERSGYTDAEWDQEMELSFESVSGTPVYGEYINRGLHLVDRIPMRPELVTYRAWDYGFRRPALLLAQHDPEGNVLRVVHELMGLDIPIQVFADAGLWLCGQPLSRLLLVRDDFEPESDPDFYEAQRARGDETHQHRLARLRNAADTGHLVGVDSWDGMPQFRELRSTQWVDYDDPAGSQQSASGEMSARQVLIRRGICPRPSVVQAKSRVELTREVLLARPDGDLPRLEISRAGCPILCEALLRGYRYPEAKEHKDPPTVPLKDGWFEHLANTLEYLVCGIAKYETEHFRHAKPKPGSVAYLRAQIRKYEEEQQWLQWA